MARGFSGSSSALAAGLWFCVAAGSAAGADAVPAGRVPWVGSRVVGSPEPPPPFASARAFPNATFNHPLLFVRMPGSDRFFVGEQKGVLFSIRNRADARPELAIDLAKEARTPPLLPDAAKVDALYALAFHPRFVENRYCYVCYTLKGKDRKAEPLANGSRVSRFTVTNAEPPRLDPASEQVILTWREGGHNGCDMHFGPDGFLYVSTGDSARPNPPDPLTTGQDISDLLSSVLRIDVDRRDAGMNYAVPQDNPFVGLKGARPEVWAYGFRNPWRMSFDRKTGELWLGDVGWELWEMVHKIEKGGNYGWSITEGPQPIRPDQKPGPTPIRPPVIELPHSMAASVTGGYVYRGKKFPDLYGAYVFGDWEFRRLWAARIADGRLQSLAEIARPTVRVVAFGEDAEGELYYLDYDTGAVHTLERNDGRGQNKDFPKRLSDTGLFASVREQMPAGGVLPYEINSPQWQDGAVSQQWVALPGDSGVKLYPGEGKPVPGQVDWHKFRLHFPKDAVLVKTLSLALEGAGPRKVETQILHFDGADWRPYSFAWRDDQSDADLVPVAGGEKVLTVPDSLQPLGRREQVWPFASRAQCAACHHPFSKYTLAFNVGQLNREVADGKGHSLNQLERLGRTGHLVRVGKDEKPQKPFDAATAAREPRSCDPRDATAATAERARSYLHANCSHCHRDGGGGTVTLELLADKPLKALQIVDVPPARGDFGLADARIVAPGHAERSVLYYRMSKFGRDRMPHLGSERPDEEGLKLIAAWIAELYRPTATAASDSLDATSLAAALARPGTAMPLGRRLGRGELSATERERVLHAAGQLSPGFVRDLFEGYLPPDGKGRRLGPNPRPASILVLAGDAERGRTLFWSEALQCAACHKVGDKGTSIGPDLTAIGKQRSREDLLESLLEPSRRIEPAFTAYTVRTAAGKSWLGLVVRRNEKEIVLRDSQNKEVVVPAADVDSVRASRVSLMPDGQMSKLTPLEAADLLQYLLSLK